MRGDLIALRRGQARVILHRIDVILRLLFHEVVLRWVLRDDIRLIVAERNHLIDHVAHSDRRHIGELGLGLDFTMLGGIARGGILAPRRCFVFILEPQSPLFLRFVIVL